MAPRTIRRQPLSCENCRHRKIRCTGNQAPCDACIRRGFHATCYFVRAAGGVQRDTQHQDLLDRIAGLEALMKQHIGVSSSSNIASQRNTGLPTPTDYSTNSPVQLDVANSQVTADDAVQSSFPLIGSLLELPGGYIRFMPHTQAFNSEDMTAFMHAESPPSTQSALLCFPFSTETSLSRQTLLELLPSKWQCEQLMQRYLTVFSPLFHILHDPTLHADYVEFSKAPSNAPLAFLALLFVILAVAVLTLEVDHPLLEELSRESPGITRIRSIASRYRQAAMKCLSADQFMLRHNLHTVKTLVLLIYAMSHTDGPTWPLLGLTLHIATAIGCHIDPRHLGVGNIEAEERRRCWAGLKMLYQNQATCMGNLLPNPVSAQVDLPADVNDDEITEDSIVVSDDNPFAIKPPTQMTYILYKFRLYKVATDICHATLSLLPLHSALLRSLNDRIVQEENEHRRRFSNASNLPLHHRANLQILKNYTNQLYLILHRPYLKTISPRQRADPMEMDLLRKSRMQCKNAALAILDSHQQLSETPGFGNYYWYVYRLGSFNAFLGASTLVAILLDPQLLNLDDHESAIILSVVQACADRLESMVERSEVCAKAAPILRRLLQKTELRLQARPSQRPDRAGTSRSTVVAAAALRPAASTGIRDDEALFGGVDANNTTYTNTMPVASLNHHNSTSSSSSSSISTTAGPFSSSSIDGSYVNNPTANIDLDGWNTYPELNAIMTSLPPEQWLAPSAFYWDRCWNPGGPPPQQTAVEPRTSLPNV